MGRSGRRVDLDRSKGAYCLLGLSSRLFGHTADRGPSPVHRPSDFQTADRGPSPIHRPANSPSDTRGKGRRGQGTEGERGREGVRRGGEGKQKTGKTEENESWQHGIMVEDCKNLSCNVMQEILAQEKGNKKKES